MDNAAVPIGIDRNKIRDLVIDGLLTDGGHHKQWFLEQVLKELGFNVKELWGEHDWDKGIAP